jgi:hypothetical protein
MTSAVLYTNSLRAYESQALRSPLLGVNLAGWKVRKIQSLERLDFPVIELIWN